MAGKPLIHESFKLQSPPPWMRETVDRLIGSLSPAHFAGIRSVVLTDAAAIGKGKTRRVGKRKFHARECRGFYHPASRTEGAWIELVVDNIVPASTPKSFLWFQFYRDLRVAQTLYHEIGHHLDATVGSATRGGEAAAEDWRRRLSKIHFRKKYPLIRSFVLSVRWVFRAVLGTRRREPAT